MKTEFLLHLQSELSRLVNPEVQVSGGRQVFGGDINATYILTCNHQKYFIKVNAARFADMHEKEKSGLELMRAANTCLKIPAPVMSGTFGQHSYLLMEYLEKGTESTPLWWRLAAGLAQLHQTTQSHFGLPVNNYIGTVVQKNAAANTWALFYAQQRILPLMKQAYDQQKCTGTDIQMAEQFCNSLPALMPEEPPALLHGDLWSGNRMFTTAGQAAIYDPAVYYGHREMDIAMTLLFGGFDAHFYAAYNEALPLEKGWRQRAEICQLYPLLVHFILFGGHYYNSVKSILKKYTWREC